MATCVASWKCMDAPDKARLMLIPVRVVEHREWWRLLTHGVVHADWMHLAMNMFVLYEFGRTVQADLGFLGMAGLPGLYVCSLVAGSLPALMKHKHNPRYRSLGASGAVSAVLVAYIVLHPTHTLLLFFVIPIPATLAGVLFFGMKGAWPCVRHQGGPRRPLGRRSGRVDVDLALGTSGLGRCWAKSPTPFIVHDLVTSSFGRRMSNVLSRSAECLGVGEDVGRRCLNVSFR